MKQNTYLAYKMKEIRCFCKAYIFRLDSMAGRGPREGECDLCGTFFCHIRLSLLSGNMDIEANCIYLEICTLILIPNLWDKTVNGAPIFQAVPTSLVFHALTAPTHVVTPQGRAAPLAAIANASTQPVLPYTVNPRFWWTLFDYVFLVRMTTFWRFWLQKAQNQSLTRSKNLHDPQNSH